jgi:glutamate racemase
MNIGLFDSGLGGLTILKAVAKNLPEYDYLFYGDTANLPYGDKSESDVYSLTSRGVRWLFEHDCALVIVACNTASAATVRKLQDEFLPSEYPERRLLGVIVPTVEELIFSTPTNVTLIATKRTVDSGKYDLEIENKNIKNVLLTSIATPDLVPLIECGEVSVATDVAADVIIKHTPDAHSIILGCTHYTKLKNELRERFSEKKFISQDEIIPTKLATYLQRHPEIETKLSKNQTRTIHLTEHRPDYDQLAGFFLGGVLLPE